MGKKRHYCSHYGDFVSRGTRSRHLKQIAERKESASEAESESDSISDVETSSEVPCLEIRDSFEDREECFRADLASGDCGDIGDSVSEGETYRRFHGSRRHLGSGANAAKFTVNVWEKS